MWNIDTILTYLNIDLSRLRNVFLYDPQAPMIFSSGLFLWLFAAFVVVYLLLQRRTTARLLFVTLFSYYFYYKSSGTYFFLLALVTVSDFLIARFMERTTAKWKRKVVGHIEPGYQLGITLLLQVHQFLWSVLGIVYGGTLRSAGYFLACGHLILYFPVAELYD